MRAHTRFEEKRCGDRCSRRITSVGVFVRFFWVLLLLKYSKYRKIYCFTARWSFSWNHSLISLQTERHTYTDKQKGKSHIWLVITAISTVSSVRFHRICKSWQARHNLAVHNSLETGSDSAANVQALIRSLAGGLKGWCHHPLTQVVNRGECLAVLRGQ